MVVGMVDDDTFEMTISEDTFTLEKNDMILLYTDGVTEAQNEKGEEFTRANALKELKHVCTMSADDAMLAFTQRLMKFTGAAPAYDDTTIVMIKAN